MKGRASPRRDELGRPFDRSRDRSKKNAFHIGSFVLAVELPSARNDTRGKIRILIGKAFHLDL